MKIEDLLPTPARRESGTARRLVAVVPPAAPLWAVYYHSSYVGSEDELSFLPVLLLACWEERTPSQRGPDTTTTQIVPMLLCDGQVIEEEGDTANFIGLSSTTGTSPAEWREQIDAVNAKESLR